jgi:hypothetical protein
MKEYKVVRNYSGYVRGSVTYTVLAKSEEEALRNWYGGEEVSNDIIRDDTETTDVWISE